jgi:hypothetical protein
MHLGFAGVLTSTSGISRGWQMMSVAQTKLPVTVGLAFGPGVLRLHFGIKEPDHPLGTRLSR